MLNRLKEWLRNYKGVASAKGKYVDYKEAHSLQYSFFRGFRIMRPSKLMESLEAPRQEFGEWEAGEGQYKDTSLVVGYVVSKVLIAGGSGFGLLSFLGLGC